jgi:hypothetical protein
MYICLVDMFDDKGKWRRACLYTDGWIDCACVPNLALK